VSGEKLYQKVAGAADPVEALKKLKPKRWLKLYSHLLRTYDENAKSGEILGTMIVIGADRYAKDLIQRKRVKEVLG
jgi:hypothetical protein